MDRMDPYYMDLSMYDIQRIAYLTYVALVRAHHGSVADARMFIAYLNDHPADRRYFEERVIMEGIRRANLDNNLRFGIFNERNINNERERG